jgi:hypothetical protein
VGDTYPLKTDIHPVKVDIHPGKLGKLKMIYTAEGYNINDIHPLRLYHYLGFYGYD